MNDKWIPPSTFEEKIKKLLIPPGLYIKSLVKKHLKDGEPELHILRFLVDNSKNAVDIGANKGIYTFLLSQLVPKVYAFEPNPKIFEILVRSLPENAVAYDTAISWRNGNGKLLIPKNKNNKSYSNQGASLSKVSASDAHGVVEIQERTLDSYNFDNIGFIKIDVEGHESAVLKGSTETIVKNKPNMLIELEEKHTGKPVIESVQEVESYGYRAFYLEDSKLTSFTRLGAALQRKEPANHKHYIYNFIFIPL